MVLVRVFIFVPLLWLTAACSKDSSSSPNVPSSPKTVAQQQPPVPAPSTTPQPAPASEPVPVPTPTPAPIAASKPAPSLTEVPNEPPPAAQNSNQSGFQIQQDFRLPSVCFRGHVYHAWKMNLGIGEYGEYVKIPHVGLVEKSALQTSPAVNGVPCPMPEMKSITQTKEYTLPSFQLSDEDRLKVNPIYFRGLETPFALIAGAKIGSCQIFTKEMNINSGRVVAYVKEACSYDDVGLGAKVYLNPDSMFELVIPFHSIKGMEESSSTDLIYFDADTTIRIASGAVDRDGHSYSTKYASPKAIQIDGGQFSPTLDGKLIGFVNYDQGVPVSFTSTESDRLYCLRTMDGVAFCADSSLGIAFNLEYNSYMSFNDEMNVYIADPNKVNPIQIMRNAISVISKSDSVARCAEDHRNYWQAELSNNTWYFADDCNPQARYSVYTYAEVTNKTPQDMLKPQPAPPAPADPPAQPEPKKKKKPAGKKKS